MNPGRMALAILVAGVLDIGFAIVNASVAGGGAARMLAGIASGPFGSGAALQPWAPALGLAVHFAIMSLMVAAFAWAASRFREQLLRIGPAGAGIGYGLLLYGFMFWVVLPLRWPEAHPVADFWPVARMLFAHVALVGLPIAFILCPRGAAPRAGIPAAAP